MHEKRCQILINIQQLKKAEHSCLTYLIKACLVAPLAFLTLTAPKTADDKIYICKILNYLIEACMVAPLTFLTLKSTKKADDKIYICKMSNNGLSKVEKFSKTTGLKSADPDEVAQYEPPHLFLHCFKI